MSYCLTANNNIEPEAMIRVLMRFEHTREKSILDMTLDIYFSVSFKPEF